MSLYSLCLLLVCPLLLLLLALRYFRHRKLKMTALFVCLALVTGVIGGVRGYQEMDGRAKESTVSSFDRDQKENLTQRYDQAVTILSQLNFAHPDREKTEEAVKLLRGFDDEQMVACLDGACPDASVLLAYAEAMNQVATYRGHMTNKDVANDRKLLSIVQDMPQGYKGKLADKIVPFQRLIISMNEEAAKEAKLDKENAQKHAEKLSQGKYGGIRPGDSEDNITAAMGEPVRVNVTQGEGQNLKQYVFNHNGKSIYVYTKDGVVTDVVL
ncbi:hypothetical protein SELR_24850 [Selenomonas ruminantium subsp. lactilytica TAM6421]|uniref:Uncharacterized protein n=1 Tax=Selenomonas ruminantium subsp. lactilytica (strain NBRC 103574 / TAM6421) TaxID=927704 RepID=I0GTV6_SELRL|nr:hypothetical protein [Selenomonas ruminantium]BAL84193.1 hypothetical protein SELR_24850 [Selenomonas ruminantium subsp. lactilytica TAM6421]